MYENSKGSDQLVHLCSLVRLLNSCRKSSWYSLIRVTHLFRLCWCTGWSRPFLFVCALRPFFAYLYHSLGIFSRWQIDDIFLIFPRKQDMTFHANCLLRRQFAWNVISCFLGKIRKIFQSVGCWKFYPECYVLKWLRFISAMSVFSLMFSGSFSVVLWQVVWLKSSESVLSVFLIPYHVPT